MQDTKIYAVRGPSGWLQTKAASKWTQNLADARFYMKLGSARGWVTRLCRAGTPARIVEFTLANPREMDENERVQKVIDKKAAEAALRRQAQKQAALESAQQELARAQERVRQLSGK